MPRKKLTDKDIKEIKKLKAQIEAEGGVFNYSQVAREYGVSGPTIRRNVEPNETDKNFKSYYNPESDKKSQQNYRRYNLKLNKNNEKDRLCIKKLDSLTNKQLYLKKLILKDLSEKE